VVSQHVEPVVPGDRHERVKPNLAGVDPRELAGEKQAVAVNVQRAWKVRAGDGRGPVAVCGMLFHAQQHAVGLVVRVVLQGLDAAFRGVGVAAEARSEIADIAAKFKEMREGASKSAKTKIRKQEIQELQVVLDGLAAALQRWQSDLPQHSGQLPSRRF
jgi:hypothetical protein